MRKSAACLLLFVLLCPPGCAKKRLARTMEMEVTAYCGCSKCCEWKRGSWRYLKVDFWNRYVASGPRKGEPYSGLTASGTEPREPKPGLFSADSLKRPWTIPVRIVFFPWLMSSRDGAVAADTRYHPFGTRMFVPGYGFGRVEDRGRAIKGEGRIDVYFDSHSEALEWGRRKVRVRIVE